MTTLRRASYTGPAKTLPTIWILSYTCESIYETSEPSEHSKPNPVELSKTSEQKIKPKINDIAMVMQMMRQKSLKMTSHALCRSSGGSWKPGRDVEGAR